MSSRSIRSADFNAHLFVGDRLPDVAKVLEVRRNGILQPFAARYIINSENTTVPVASVINCFVPIVHMAARPSYNISFDGKDMHRGATGIGSFAIRDRRIIQCNDLHTVNNVSFYIPISDLDSLSYQLKAPRIDHLPSLLDEDKYDPIMFHLAKTVEEMLSRPSEASALFVSHLYDAVRIHICEAYGGCKDRARADRGGLSPWQAAQVKDFLLNDLRGNIGLAGLAVTCGMSERHFARAFKHSFGMPPHRWLLVQRIERAQFMLANSATPISVVAFDCGFADQSHMTRVFSKLVGASPAVWRQRRRH